jgi:hypothetical protein
MSVDGRHSRETVGDEQQPRDGCAVAGHSALIIRVAPAAQLGPVEDVAREDRAAV